VTVVYADVCVYNLVTYNMLLVSLLAPGWWLQ